MRLELNPSDLAPEFQRGSETENNVDQACSTFQVSFEKLNEKAQTAVRIVGHATFYSWDGETYELVYAPKESTTAT